MTRVRKAIIPVAGYGTGFLPATKAQPKELLPIVDKPIIQFTVEEAIKAGIEEIVIITGRQKRSVEDHFDSNPELEANLKKSGKLKLLEIVESTTYTNLFFARQPFPAGLGEALMHARAFVDNEPFAILLADNIYDSERPVIKDLMDIYNQYAVSSVAGSFVSDEDMVNYGMIEKGLEAEIGMPDVYKIAKLIEKPTPEQITSNLGLSGRYVLVPEIFEIIDQLQPGPSGEIELTDAINILNQTQRVFVKEINKKRYDVGNKLGYMDMSINYGLSHPETKDELVTYLKKLSKTL